MDAKIQFHQVAMQRLNFHAISLSVIANLHSEKRVGAALPTLMGPLFSLWGKMPDLQKQKIENMSIFLASWIYLMVLIDNSSFFVIKNCIFNV